MNERSLSNKKMNERSFTAEPSSSFLRNMRESPQKIQALGMHNRLLSYGGVRRKMGGAEKLFASIRRQNPHSSWTGKAAQTSPRPFQNQKYSPSGIPRRFGPKNLTDFLLPKPLKREECGTWKLSFSRGERQVWDAICKKIERLTGKRLLAGKRTSAAPCPFPAPILHLPPPAKIKFALPCAGLLGIISQKNSACPRPRVTKS